jgi:hypothetical protein
MKTHPWFDRCLVTVGMLEALAMFGLSWTAEAKSDAHYFRFVGLQQQEIVLQPMTPPLFGVVQTAGPRIEEHALLNCVWRQERETTPHGDPVPAMVGYCEEGVVLRLIGVDLNH